MYLTHFFYENSSSGANSYVYIASSKEDAISYIESTLVACVSERDGHDEAQTLCDLLRDKNDNQGECANIEGMELSYDNTSFFLESQNGESVYRARFTEATPGTETIL